MSENFQQKISKNMTEEKLSQFYLLTVNNLLKFTDGLQHTFFNFGAYKEAIKNYKFDINKMMKQTVWNINAKVTSLDKNIKDSDTYFLEQTFDQSAREY